MRRVFDVMHALTALHDERAALMAQVQRLDERIAAVIAAATR